MITKSTSDASAQDRWGAGEAYFGNFSEPMETILALIHIRNGSREYRKDTHVDVLFPLTSVGPGSQNILSRYSYRGTNSEVRRRPAAEVLRRLIDGRSSDLLVLK